MYTSDDYVVAKENRGAYEGVCDFVDRASGSIVVYGSEQSGKTHLLSIGKERAGKKALLVPTAAIMLRFELDLGDEFFDTLGEIPILFIDEVEEVADYPETAKLLELMIAERDRKGLATCFASRKTPGELGLVELQAAMAKFEVFNVAPFGKESLKEAIGVFEKSFSTENSRSLSGDAREYLALSSNSIDEARNKTRFLLQIAEVEKETVFDVAMVKKLVE